MTKDSDRLLSLELNFKNFMGRVEEKFNVIIKKLEDHSELFATKKELEEVKSSIGYDKDSKNKKALQWIQTRWAIIIAIIGVVGMVLNNLYT